MVMKRGRLGWPASPVSEIVIVSVAASWAWVRTMMPTGVFRLDCKVTAPKSACNMC